MNMVISELPDDILVDIVSLLTFKEAGRTTILSKRWKHIWGYNRIVKLEMDISHEMIISHEPNHFTWVDQIVRSYKASTIDEFLVSYQVVTSYYKDSTIESSNNIDNWFIFAREKGVKWLKIDLSPYKGATVNFPSLPLCASLTSLELGCININGETLEYFLCNCQALEYLSVKQSDSLVSLKVSGSYLNLKYLRLYDCREIKELEISAPKLESVCYYGPQINVKFKSNPKLAQVSFGSRYANDLGNICSDLSSCLSQIKEFTLDSESPMMSRSLSIEEPISFTRLEKLDVVANPSALERLYSFVPLMKACPLLKHFKLRLLQWYGPCKWRKEIIREAYPHYNLKVVEIVGFEGHTIDLEFAIYLLQCVVSLDKIIIDTRDVRPRIFEDMMRRIRGTKSSAICEDMERRRVEARNSAARLKAYLKHGTQLQVI